MLCSVLMPTFNRVAWLPGCVESILSQDGEFELIILENGSSDGTREYLHSIRDPRLKVIERDVNSRDISCLVDEARGEYLQFFCDDDLMFPGAIRRKSEWLDAHPEHGMVFSAAHAMDADGTELGRMISGDHGNSEKHVTFDDQFASCSMPYPTVMVRADLFRSVMVEAGSIGAAGATDWATWLCCLEKMPACYLPDPTACLRIHSGQESEYWGKAGGFKAAHLAVWNHFRNRGHRPDWGVLKATALKLGITDKELTPVIRPRICLSMIVKNEAHVIQRCLESVKGVISSWCVVDTGSSDGTQDIIRDFLSDVHGTLHEREWVDFSTARNQALELAPPCDYIMVIDADEVLQANPITHPLGAGVYQVEVRHHGSCADRVWLVRRDYAGRWKGAIHEDLEQTSPWVKINGPWIESFGDGGRHGNHLNEDLKILFREIQKDPKNPRNYYYLGMTYLAAGDEEQAMKALKIRASMAGDPEEKARTLAIIGG